eukprot:TRINITY_DN44648_c0_g1_i2.p1 TRINITY_DN44648_c0_g1~~TRINITY_DN44648_c0_g1_i2.p1  ORF type:complete len:341 (-),score=105.95 TRINITY_DN44648_c0_g1_i2:87-1109(-)
MLMDSKCKAVRSRISAAKETQADKLKPTGMLLEKIGADIAEIMNLISASDKRLDGELAATNDRFMAECEALEIDRAQAKKRMLSRILPACETLKKEFNQSKMSVREKQEKRHHKSAEKGFAIVDRLESEHEDRARSDTRIISNVGKKHAATDGAVLAERNACLQSQHDLMAKVDEACGVFMREHQQERKGRQDHVRATMQDFRASMAKLADSLDSASQTRVMQMEDVNDKQMVRIENLTREIEQEGTLRKRSEAGLVQLLEDFHQKLHRDVSKERAERQNTERVLMKLLEESVEQIAAKADQPRLNQLKEMHKQRVAAREQRDQEMAGRVCLGPDSVGRS